MKFPLRDWPASLPPERIVVGTIVAIYLLLGLIDHDPWRIDDAVTLAIAHGFSAQQWLVPQLAGEPWLTSPPLYHWLAALFGNSLDALMPWHAAARLASALILGGGLYALAVAVRHLHGEAAARLSPLLAVGTLGLLVPSHEAQPALTSFLAITMQLAALALWKKHLPLAGAILGLGLGIGFLGSGVSTLLPMLGIALAATIHPHWRHDSLRAWLVMAVIAVPLVAAWPLALAHQDAQLLQRWWGNELQSLGGRTALPGKRFEILALASWPVLPLGLWMLWLERHRLTRATNFIAFASLTITLMFYLRANEPTHAMMPLLAVLCLLATPAAGRLRRGAASAFDWFGAMTFTLFLALVWLGGVSIFTGMPARVAKNFTKPAPGFIPEWSWFAFILAVLTTLVWLRFLVAAPRSPWRAATRWALGVTSFWVLLATLWLPWVDYGKSYRSASADFRQALGKNPGCIERQGLDEAHRASLDYFEGIRTIPVAPDSSSCNYRIVPQSPKAEKTMAGWTLVLERSRPGDRSETLRLYRRDE